MQVLLGTERFHSWGRDVLFLAPGEGLAEMADGKRADKGAVVVSELSAPSETFGMQTVAIGDSCCDSDAEDVEEKPAFIPPASDILSWNEKVVNSVQEPPPLAPDSFERGTIGSMSVNDVLMTKGLIEPCQYVQFFNLRSFSHL
jgi:hypothetical protein